MFYSEWNNEISTRLHAHVVTYRRWHFIVWLKLIIKLYCVRSLSPYDLPVGLQQQSIDCARLWYVDFVALTFHLLTVQLLSMRHIAGQHVRQFWRSCVTVHQLWCILCLRFARSDDLDLLASRTVEVGLQLRCIPDPNLLRHCIIELNGKVAY